jgi:hypothetical protein
MPWKKPSNLNPSAIMHQIYQSTKTLENFAQLPVFARAEVDTWLREFTALTPPITANLAAIARRMDCAPSTARRKYDAWLHSGKSWQALVNKKYLTTKTAISQEFLNWYTTLAEKNQRKTAPAFRIFAEMWRRGETIPGLDNDQPRYQLPKGCTYENLQRKLTDRFALTAMRRGLSVAIAQHGPKIFTTRAGLQVGEYYMFDDLWHDHFVVYKGQPVRVLELDALDVFSACKVTWGCRPRTQRDDGTFAGLKERNMRMLLANLLWHYGYNPTTGTTLMAEHGTAAIRPEVERILHDRTKQHHGQPKITVQRSGIIGEQQAVIGLGHGQGKGNFRFKAPLESLRNLIHNELAFLPAQTGKDTEYRPEHTHGILEETDALLKIAAKLPPEKAALLKLNMLTYHDQFLPLLETVYDRINSRHEHRLEGWSKIGGIEIRYRLSPETDTWISNHEVMQMPETTRAMLLQLARSDARYLTEHRLSPKEMWNRGRTNLVKLPGYIVAELLGHDLSRELKTDSNYFEFQDQELDPEPLRYETRITTPEGLDAKLPNDKYQIYINPFDLEQIFVHDARHRYLGTARRVTRIQRDDVLAREHAFHRRSKELSDLSQDMRARHIHTTIEATERLRHNTDLIRSVITPETLTPTQRRISTQDADQMLSPNQEPRTKNQEPETPNQEPAPDLLESIL